MSVNIGQSGNDCFHVGTNRCGRFVQGVTESPAGHGSELARHTGNYHLTDPKQLGLDDLRMPEVRPCDL